MPDLSRQLESQEFPGEAEPVDRLLRVGDRVDKNARFGARRLNYRDRGLWNRVDRRSAGPILGLLKMLDAADHQRPVDCCHGDGCCRVRRIWIADHPARWSYSSFIAVVLVLLATATVMDLSMPN